MTKKYYYIIALIIVIITGVLIYSQIISSDKRSCENAGGIWLWYGKLCNPLTTDAGKECSDSDECEGYCQPELSETEKELFEKGEIIHTDGKCGSYKFGISGCRVYVEGGKVDPDYTLCID